jgi:hypothetical protein
MVVRNPRIRYAALVFSVWLLSNCLFARDWSAIWTRDFSRGAPSGKVIFADTTQFVRDKFRGAEAYAPRLYYFNGEKWQWIKQRALEDEMYRPFILSRYFALIVPEGKRQFRIELGDGQQDIEVDVQAGMQHVVPFVIEHIDQVTEQSGWTKIKKMWFRMIFSETVTFAQVTQPGAEASLRNAMLHAQPAVREKACNDLHALGERTPLSRETVEVLQKVAAQDPYERIRKRAREAASLK